MDYTIFVSIVISNQCSRSQARSHSCQLDIFIQQFPVSVFYNSDNKTEMQLDLDIPLQFSYFIWWRAAAAWTVDLQIVKHRLMDVIVPAPTECFRILRVGKPLPYSFIQFIE